MKYIYLILLILYFICYSSAHGGILSGNVSKEEYLRQNGLNLVRDSETGQPIKGAEISAPSQGITTFSDENGYFKLELSPAKSFILAVKKEGYTPFSLTISTIGQKNPLMIAIKRKSENDLVIDSALHHLGDDNFALNSSNASKFRLRAESPNFTKKFYIGNILNKHAVYLKIGSIIGLDTDIEHKLSNIEINSSSTPASVYINGIKITELRINGDNQSIIIPMHALKSNSENVITIETGVNKASRKRDYDDIEFLNLILEAR